MPKKGANKNSKVSGADSDVENILGTKIETIFEDTKSITGISPKFKWGELYQMIRDHDIFDVGLEEMVLYQNIKSLGITKEATCPELFPCSDFIGWILPQDDPT